MKRFSILFLVALLGFTGNAYAQEEAEKQRDEQVEALQNKKIKVALDKVPNVVLVALRDSYATHFVMNVYRTNTQNDLYYLELKKGSERSTVAVDTNGRFLKEFQKGELFPQNAVANKN